MKKVGPLGRSSFCNPVNLAGYLSCSDKPGPNIGAKPNTYLDTPGELLQEIVVPLDIVNLQFSTPEIPVS
jgi:hypothetical protein